MGAPNDADAPFTRPSTLTVEMHYAISQGRTVF